MADGRGAAARPYDAREHAPLGCAPDLAAGEGLPIDAAAIADAVALVPDEWLINEPGFAQPDDVRAAYEAYFAARLAARDSWLAAQRETVAAGATPRQSHRRGRPELLTR